ncbi:hexaprenyl-diphosphate synthase, partial [Lecanoromycetidae sp. Uapishka_2]
MRGRLTPLRTTANKASLTNPRASICPGCLRLRRDFTNPNITTQYPPARRRSQSTWAQAATVAQHMLNGRASADARFAGVSVDPLRIVAKELKFLTNNIQNLLGSGHPMLDTVAKYYTNSEGKHIRPLLVLLMSRATALTTNPSRQPLIPTSSTIDNPISPSRVLSDINPSATAGNPISTPSLDTAYVGDDSDILPSQRRLAEITELIHTASLLHDDVIDNSTSRRSSPSANISFGNKMAVLAGDFLLGRASVALARLRDAEVIELLATVIANLVEGEFMQLKNTAQDEANPVWTEDTLSYYLQKTYLKSASLISKSCRATALLGQTSPEVVEAAYSYGRNLGLAFQLVDDMLDYTTSSQALGKPAGADLELGLATAPLLFAWKDNQQLGVLVGRKFSAEGDVQMARELVARSSGLEQTRALAQEYADKAADAVSKFPDSEAKDGLLEMCIGAVKRNK